MNDNVSGANNTAFGTASLYANTASNNTAVGFEAGYSNTSGEIVAFGFRALKGNTTGAGNSGFGNDSLLLNTTGAVNTAFGNYSFSNNTTGSYNTGLGYNLQTGNYSTIGMFGINDTATGNNQMRFGSSSYVYGAVTTEVVVSDKTWSVFINGTAYKILLKA
jgi:hypothetical protein